MKNLIVRSSRYQRDDMTLVSLASHKSPARLGLRISAGSPSHLVRALGCGRVPDSLCLVFNEQIQNSWNIVDTCTKMKDIRAQFQKDGYVIFEDFFQPEEIEELRACGEEFTNKLPPESERKIFNTIQLQQNKDKYFLDSANKISIFFESEALEEDGKLKVHPRVSLNKVGHALHWLHPTFRKYTFDERIKEIAFQLNYEEPMVCQSMYIYKNPGIGSEVTMHQDASYLYVEPMKLVGFWIALEDATIENGCLWIAPGSHQSGTHRRYMRNKDSNSQELLIFDRPAPCYPLSNFRPVPVRKGSCILIHGQVVHFSYPNKSETSRHAYTFHVIETKHVSYSKENWLQPPAEGFASLYKN